jgi:predicted nuclease of predicted toxin-antitoxin system
MRFLLDENVSYRVCPHLKAAGHDAVHVAEIGLTSADDQVIVGRARDQDRVLVSCDHDFVQLLFASGDTRPLSNPGPRYCWPPCPANSPNCCSLERSRH